MTTALPSFHLASSSPRRREILVGLGLRFSFAGVDLDESRQDHESVEEMVLRLARDKATDGHSPDNAHLPVLGADTVVVLGDRVFGKPAGEQDALDMLAALSGCRHRVLTAVALRQRDRIEISLSDTAVRFRDISPDEARHYWHSGEPADKAGSYAIQGLGGMFVASISGSYSGVVGLPVFETVQLLDNAGIKVSAALEQHD
ncbi:MAG: Maf family protein [Woeseiaceae bacterium]|nr:Maf family protein [Woeseiaceae bacterium]